MLYILQRMIIPQSLYHQIKGLYREVKRIIVYLVGFLVLFPIFHEYIGQRSQGAIMSFLQLTHCLFTIFLHLRQQLLPFILFCLQTTNAFFHIFIYLFHPVSNRLSLFSCFIHSMLLVQLIAKGTISAEKFTIIKTIKDNWAVMLWTSNLDDILIGIYELLIKVYVEVLYLLQFMGYLLQFLGSVSILGSQGLIIYHYLCYSLFTLQIDRLIIKRIFFGFSYIVLSRRSLIPILGH